MKKIIAVSLLSLVSSVAMASGSGFYVSGKLGTSILKLSDQKWEESDVGFYESYNGGSKTKAVLGGGIALGYDLYDVTSLPLRAEFDIALRGKASSKHNLFYENNSFFTASDDSKNDITLNTFMVNAYYDFKNETNFTPYVSVGLGLASIKHKSTYSYEEKSHHSMYYGYDSFSKSKTKSNFAWSLGIGSQYAINDNLSLDLSYRFLDAGKSSLSYTEDNEVYKSKVKVRTNDVMFGVVYRF
ncbi:TPA: porin family protein [Providencia rettgeri]|uniref:outer membrane protein n=1 Tax=Providencia TaxID=586 RepID=UPI001B8F5EBB|nr:MULTISPECIES: outer membrane beta-barrel protein [Providencia]EMB5787591.1 porin family protein [Providencia rettgeri]MDH2370354.1 OmpW family outer membrane protein [Providencia rettgeri]MDK7747027.1 OmpW family outer membrane protein [Providencia rettgeri]MDK7759912.1 OmpW family outer membrane protein [Providencia rettgeri]HBC7429834.1 porin family protein [Providencia rettgeri]